MSFAQFADGTVATASVESPVRVFKIDVDAQPSGDRACLDVGVAGRPLGILGDVDAGSRPVVSRLTRLSALRAMWLNTCPRDHPGRPDGASTSASDRVLAVTSNRDVAASISAESGAGSQC